MYGFGLMQNLTGPQSSLSMLGNMVMPGRDVTINSIMGQNQHGCRGRAQNLSLVLLVLPCHHPPSSEAIMLMQYACSECRKMNWSNVYNYLLL